MAGRPTGLGARPIALLALVMAVVGVVGGLTGCQGAGGSDTGAGKLARPSRGSTTTKSAPSTTGGQHTTTTTGPSHRDYPAGAFDAVDTALDGRVASAGLSGGILRLVADDGTVLHEHSTGSVTGSTPLDVASSSKWFTAATFMTFVDQGVIGLDDDISRWLPEFSGAQPPVTPRELLSHTSGVHDNPCQNGGVSLADCVRTLASAPIEFPAGTAFSYGNSPFLVVGRLVEVLGGADFAAVVHDRLTGPLGMADTTWPGAPGAPNPAFGVRTTVDDYGRFLAMLLHDGRVDGRQLLSSQAVDELLRNQVARYDTSHDYSVGITGIPRYGLGCWDDVVDAAGRTVVVSGNGGKGLYPWVDFATRTWGIVGVQDERGAQYAVPASQAVETAARTALGG
jgi:CubicO group peptidase (beta-lactamase class C family)